MRRQQSGPESERGGGAESSQERNRGRCRVRHRGDAEGRDGGTGCREGTDRRKDTQGAGGRCRKNSPSEAWGWTARG